jgi:hypothetical protein
VNLPEVSARPADLHATAETFAQAVTLHRQGRVPAADTLYQAVLAQIPIIRALSISSASLACGKATSATPCA